MNDQDAIALKPCPWCGATMPVPEVIEGSTFRWRQIAGCCTHGPEVRHDTLADQAAAELDSTRRAIEAWNTRSTPADGGDAKDAARYRWVRATTNHVTCGGEKIDVHGQHERWDAAIDAAMSESQGEGK